jgi:hypothetical protein
MPDMQQRVRTTARTSEIAKAERPLSDLTGKSRNDVAMRMTPEAYEQEIVTRAEAAKAANSGINFTDVSDDDLRAFLRRRRVSA